MSFRYGPSIHFDGHNWLMFGPLEKNLWPFNIFLFSFSFFFSPNVVSEVFDADNE